VIYLALELARILLGLDVEGCISSRFGGVNDKHRGGPSPYLGRRVEYGDSGIAHRTRPLGSWVVICNMDHRWPLCSAAQTIDRGPYGAMYPAGPKPRDGCKKRDSGRWWCVKKPFYGRDGGRYRGCADVAPKTQRAIDHDGWARVRLYSVPRKWGRDL
jgi:hypothetical protein